MNWIAERDAEGQWFADVYDHDGVYVQTVWAMYEFTLWWKLRKLRNRW